MVSKSVLVDKCLKLKEKIDWITNIDSTYYIYEKDEYDFYLYLSEYLEATTKCFEGKYDIIDSKTLDEFKKIFDLSTTLELHPMDIYKEYLEILYQILDDFLEKYYDDYEKLIYL